MHGHEEFIEAWRDPEHGEHEQMRSCAGPRYDPVRFYLKLVNEILKTFRAQTRKRKR